MVLVIGDLQYPALWAVITVEVTLFSHFVVLRHLDHPKPTAPSGTTLEVFTVKPQNIRE